MNLEKIKFYGELSVQKFLTSQYPGNAKNQLMNDKWIALEFFTSKVYYQGRKNAVSEKISFEARAVLNLMREKGINIFDPKEFGQVEFELGKRIGRGKVGKGADVTMTIELLNFISQLDDNNIIKYGIEKIKNGELVELYNELDNIHSIGFKVASLCLRDLITLFDLEKGKLSPDDYILLQPIDTWVRQVTTKFGIIDDNDSVQECASKIVNYCLANNISPIIFNRGVWYLGANAFEILLDEIMA